jgi:hypothetical protein
MGIANKTASPDFAGEPRVIFPVRRQIVSSELAVLPRTRLDSVQGLISAFNGLEVAGSFF